MVKQMVKQVVKQAENEWPNKRKNGAVRRRSKHPTGRASETGRIWQSNGAVNRGNGGGGGGWGGHGSGSEMMGRPRNERHLEPARPRIGRGHGRRGGVWGSDEVMRRREGRLGRGRSQGGQGRRSKSAVKLGGRNRRSNMAVKRGGQSIAIKCGGQTWRSNKAVKHGGQTRGVQHGGQKTRLSNAAVRHGRFKNLTAMLGRSSIAVKHGGQTRRSNTRASAHPGPFDADAPPPLFDHGRPVPPSL